MKKIIAFAGRKRSGKGILSNVIKENTNKTVIITIASYLKSLCCDLLGIDYETLNLKKDNGDILNVKPDQRWYNLINKKTNITSQLIKKEIQDRNFKDVRELLQVIGTDLIRKYQPQWHINCMIDDINSYSDDYTIVIDDVRFPNEREAIEKLGGRVFFIIRPNWFDVSNHISEISLKWNQFNDDNIIINDIPKEYLLEYFRISYIMDFKKNKDIPIYLSNNLHFKLECNVNFPNTNSSLLKEILIQNSNDIRFQKNGIIRYFASNRQKANDFNNSVLNNNCQNWKRDFIIYNPLINENLKSFM